MCVLVQYSKRHGDRVNPQRWVSKYLDVVYKSFRHILCSNLIGQNVTTMVQESYNQVLIVAGL